MSVDCFYEGENMLVIHPDECIDCGVCVPECPVDAIKPDTEPGLEKWLRLNADQGRVARPPREVADVFRAHGAAWREANAGHVSLAQLKVMSAIETCRTAVPGQGAVKRKKWPT